MKKLPNSNSTKLGVALGILVVSLVTPILSIDFCWGDDTSITSSMKNEQDVQKFHQEQEQLLKASLLKQNQEKATQFVSWLAKTPYSEIKKSHRVAEQIHYINSCLSKVDIWITAKEGSHATQYSLAQKYQDDIASGNYANAQEKQIKADYIAQAAGLDTKQQRLQLITDLKANKQKQASSNELSNCLNVADSTIRALYKYDVYKDEATVKSDFISLKRLADKYSLAENLDFSVHILLAEEANQLKSGVSIYQDNASNLKHKRHKPNILAENKPMDLQVMQATNQQLSEIDPSHPGFQSRAYKQRMIRYHYLEGYWDHQTNDQS
jgi:hypothetical protein